MFCDRSVGAFTAEVVFPVAAVFIEAAELQIRTDKKRMLKL